ncbi:MAG: sporulation protein YtxC [Cellulosilyticaceae bacterium]
MVQYIITTTKYNKILKQSIEDTGQKSFNLSDQWKESLKGEMHLFVFEVASRDKKLILEKLATMISDIVQSCVLTKFAKEYLKNRVDLTMKEKREIENMFILNNYVAKEEGVSYISYYLLYTPILKALEEQKLLNIEGWIVFRTHQYKIILEDILEQTIYDYETQKDYLRFVNLLRESRRIQQALENTLHLIQTPDKKMRVFNTDKQDITEEYIKIYCEELLKDEGVTSEDLIMNIFITVSPEKVVIHNKKDYINLKFVETIEIIFEGQIEYCEGCAQCLSREKLLTD